MGKTERRMIFLKTGKRLFVVAATLAFAMLLLAGCSNVNNSSSGDSSNQMVGADESVKFSIDINDAPWTAEPGINDGKRRVMFSVTNNSQYVITSIRLDMKLKDGVEQADVESVYADILDNDWITIDDVLSDPVVGVLSTVDPGVTLSYPCTVHTFYLTSAEQLDLFTPDMLTIQYIDGDKLYTQYYDYSSRSYSLDSKVVEAEQWPKDERAQLLPEPEGVFVTDITTSESRLSFDACGATAEDFKAYVEKCKEAGITVDAYEGDDLYYADTQDGKYRLDVSYSEYSGSLNAYFDAQ